MVRTLAIRSALNEMVSVVALCLSVALFIRGLANPRPRLRAVFRRPGMAACTVVVVYSLLLVYFSVVYQLDVLVIQSEPLHISDMMSMLELAPLGGAVIGAGSLCG